MSLTWKFHSQISYILDVKIGEKTTWANVNNFTGADRAKEITCMCWTNNFQNQVIFIHETVVTMVLMLNSDVKTKMLIMLKSKYTN